MQGTRGLVVAVVALVVAGAACGGDGEPSGGRARDEGRSRAITGRVVVLDGAQVCVSPDRGATRSCVPVGEEMRVDGVDVGECATLVRRAPVRIDVVDDAACAAGDLGG